MSYVILLLSAVAVISVAISILGLISIKAEAEGMLPTLVAGGICFIVVIAGCYMYAIRQTEESKRYRILASHSSVKH